MAIPIQAIIRVFENMIGESLRSEPANFRYGMKEGFMINPLFDDEDIATLARVASGERYESYR